MLPGREDGFSWEERERLAERRHKIMMDAVVMSVIVQISDGLELPVTFLLVGSRNLLRSGTRFVQVGVLRRLDACSAVFP